MTEVTRTVRTIRVPKKEIPPNPDNFGEMTWKEALDKNLIKAGMTVRFKNAEFKDIKVLHDECGLEQTLCGKLLDGIIVQDISDKKFYIIVQADIENGFSLAGRFGRVFGVEAIQKVADEICSQTSLNGLKRKFLSEKMINSITMYSKFFASYIYEPNSEKMVVWLLEVDVKKARLPRAFFANSTFLEEEQDIERTNSYKYYGIMFVLHLDMEDIVSLEKCEKIKTDKPILSKLNMFDSFITIGG